MENRIIQCNNVQDARELMYKSLNPDYADAGIINGERLMKIFPWDPHILNALGICYCIKGSVDKALEIYRKALSLKITFEEADIVITNLHSLAQSQKLRYCFKIPDPMPTPNKDELITFSITTCKRLHLFERTMNSFIECCKEDIWRIGRWICVDDNSSDEDRSIMKEKYPFFEFFFKGPNEKGHPQSMNIIRNEALKLPYLLHMEDDWEFIFKDNCISKCFEILNTDCDVKQCTLNKNYAPGINDSTDVTGGFPKMTPNGVRYFIHEYSDAKTFNIKYLTQEKHIHRCLNLIKSLKQTYEQFEPINTSQDFIDYILKHPTDELTSKFLAPKNCAFWPHFTLNPSLIKTDIFEVLGLFNLDGHFEKDYGLRYINAGFKTAYLESMRCIHIGWEDETNAYQLNECKQFHL